MDTARPPFDEDPPFGSMRYRVRRRRMPKKDFWLMIGMLAVLAGILGYAVQAYVSRDQADRGTWIANALGPPTGIASDGKLRLGSVPMAATPREVRRIHPGAVIGVDRNGRQVALFEEEGGKYRATFLDTVHGAQAYRITYRQTFNTIGHDSVMERLAAKFGRPSTGDCERKVASGSSDCRYTWWLRDSNRLQVTTRSWAGGRTDVSMVAVNTYLEGKAKPIARPPTLPPTKTQQRDLERLPID